MTPAEQAADDNAGRWFNWAWLAAWALYGYAVAANWVCDRIFGPENEEVVEL